jgi:hypothetical protein
MKTILAFLSAIFTTLILKPFDFLLFGGSGVLWRSRDEWRSMIQNDLQAAGPMPRSSAVDDGFVSDLSPSRNEGYALNCYSPGHINGPLGQFHVMEDEI